MPLMQARRRTAMNERVEASLGRGELAVAFDGQRVIEGGARAGPAFVRAQTSSVGRAPTASQIAASTSRSFLYPSPSHARTRRFSHDRLTPAEREDADMTNRPPHRPHRQSLVAKWRKVEPHGSEGRARSASIKGPQEHGRKPLGDGLDLVRRQALDRQVHDDIAGLRARARPTRVGRKRVIPRVDAGLVVWRVGARRRVKTAGGHRAPPIAPRCERRATGAGASSDGGGPSRAGAPALR